MSDRRTVRRSRDGGGRMTGAMAMAMLGVAELVIIAVLIVGVATYISHRVIERTEKQRTAGGITVAEGA